MLTRPLTLNDGNDRGRGLVAVMLHPALPLADEGDGDNETETGVFSPSVPPWSFCSSASSPPPPLPCSSLSSPSSLTLPHSFLSSPSLTPPVPPFSSTSFSTPVSLLSPPPSSLCPAPPDASSPLSSASSTCPTPPVFFTPCTAPTSSLFAPVSSSHPVLPTLHSSLPSLLSSACTPPPPLAPPLISTPLSRHDSPSLSSALSFLYHRSSLISPPPPLPLHTSALYSPASSSSAPIPPSLSSQPPTPSSPSLLPPAPPHCCPCSSLLPRLLSAHRLEVRRLLRGALASLGHRLDSLERRIRTKKKRKKRRGQRGGRGSACSPGLAEFPLNPTSSCSPAQLPPVTTCSSSTSSSSDAEDSPTPPLSSSLSQSEHRSRRGEEERERHGRKRRRKNHRGREMIENGEEEEEEEEAAGRFVGRMAVSVRRGAEEEEAPLTLQNFNHKKHRRREGGGSSQSENAASVVRRNGFRAPLLLHSTLSSSSQTCSQSEALSISSGQWNFTDFTAPLTLSSNHRAFHLWLCTSSSSSSSSFSCSPMLRFSAVAMEMISESVRGGNYGIPLRPLKDWTAPPSLSSDHCYVRTPTPSPAFPTRRPQKQRTNHSSRCLHLPRRRSLPLPLCSANGLSALLPTGQSAGGSKFLSTNGERGKRVSQIRIRRASPRETSLTPMGLPKVKRLKKKEFSLEEIYTNKNYKSPSTNRSLETIFEEPREKDGALLLIGQQRRRRLLLFPDFTQPRKRKRPQGAGHTVAMVPRKRAAARRHCYGGGPNDELDLDVMLVERLSALEDFLTRQGLDV